MNEEEGLRARKLRETREAIHRSAVRLALEVGPDCVTVAEISADAQVSPRTFFNYFPAKEDAMLGFHDEMPSDADLAIFNDTASDDLLHDVVVLMRDVFSSSPTNHCMMSERRTLLRTHPQLMQRQMTRIISVEQRITTVVAERMRASNRYAAIQDVDAAARMLVMLATNVVRGAIRSAALSAEPSAAGADDDRFLDNSLSTLREVLSTLP